MPDAKSKRPPPLAQPDNAEVQNDDLQAGESSPLLAQPQEGDDEDVQTGTPAVRGTKEATRERSKWRWPSIIAITLLAAAVVVIIVLGFVVPPAVKKYAEDALVVEPTSLSLESLTADGVRARVQANFRLDGSRVADANARHIGRVATGIMRQIGTEETKVAVHLPAFNDALLGTVLLPPLAVSLVDGHINRLDFVTDLIPGDAETMRLLANNWLEGKLDRVRIKGDASLRLKSGLIPLGTHNVVESLVFEANDIPSMPAYSIQDLVFHEVPLGDNGQRGVAANVSVSLRNDYPIGLDIPPLSLEVLMPNCDASQPNIKIASAITDVIAIHPKSEVIVDATGVIRELPDLLTRACPDMTSPLDDFMDHYLHGQDARIFIQGKASGQPDLPQWAGEILESISIPIAFPGHSFDNFIREFSLSDVYFKLPSFFAKPGTPDRKPRVSETVRVLAALSSELNIDISVESIRATGYLIYKGHKFGELNLDRWQKTTSEITHSGGREEDLIKIQTHVTDVPIDIFDSDLFADLIKILFGKEEITLDVKALVDIRVSTVLGQLVLKRVPAEGKVPVKHVPGDTLDALNPKLDDIRIVNTSVTGVQMQMTVALTNPTPYNAEIPWLNLHILQGYQVGEATVQDLDFRVGKNTGVSINASWDPLTYGGKTGHSIGRRLLSEYISGQNTTLELRAHRGSVPAAPLIGEALSKLNLTVNTPRVHPPGNDPDADKHQLGFVRDATFHILSSSATCTLASPLRHTLVHIEFIDAIAYYNHTEPIGKILYGEPFDAPPGLSSTRRLPVDWSAGRVGFDKLKQALGGNLKLDAVADVSVHIGRWREMVRYEGQGIGARVRL